MTHQSTAHHIRILAIAVLATVAGCGHRSTPPAAGGSAQPASTRPAAPPTPTTTTGETGAMGTARAFAAAICPYDWRSPVPYGQNVNAALRRYGSTAFAAARAWDASRTAAAQRALTADEAIATCTGMTGGIEDDQAGPAGTLTIRLSLQVTSQARDAAASTAQQQFLLTLRYGSGQWRIANGQW